MQALSYPIVRFWCCVMHGFVFLLLRFSYGFIAVILQPPLRQQEEQKSLLLKKGREAAAAEANEAKQPLSDSVGFLVRVCLEMGCSESINAFK